MDVEELKSESLLKELVYCENPTETLLKKFDNVTAKEESEFRSIISELKENGYIKVLWASNKPYNVTIKNSGKMYVKEIEKCEKGENVEVQTNGISKIFISHRTTDTKIADALHDFFVATGIPSERVFCSSLPGNDVKESIPKEVKDALQNSCLNIAILSRDYYDSAYCLNEAGVFWFQNTLVIPIALPEVEPGNMFGFLDSSYKIRRLDNIDDISYIYDAATRETQAKQSSMVITSRETQKLIARYNELIKQRKESETESPAKVTEASIDELTTDDEKIVLSYILERKIRKITKSNVVEWLQENEIHNVNIDNAFDLLSTICGGENSNGTLELGIEIFRQYTSQAESISKQLVKVVKEHKILSSNTFNLLWEQGAFDDEILLFIAYIVDEKITKFGDRWMAQAQVENIVQWQNKNALDYVVSSAYGKCLEYFKGKGFVYESDWTDYGNPREYTLYKSLKDLLFDCPPDYLSLLVATKNKYPLDLPF